MADDWQVGDLALCVRGGPINKGSGLCGFPVAGTLHNVQAIAIAPTVSHPRGAVCLSAETLPANRTGCRRWNACRFIKVTPNEAGEEDAETIRLLNGAPVKEPA